MTSTTGHLARIIREAMGDQGKSQVELSIDTGIPRETLRRKLFGQRDFNTDELEAVAKALGTKMSSLIAEAETQSAA